MNSPERKIQTSVTNFLYCGDNYLFLERDPSKEIDGGKINGVGGKVEPGEDYLSAAIRETAEETGLKVTPGDMKLAGVIRLEGGYAKDWVMCFFKIRVPTMEIPSGLIVPDGKLLWIPSDQVLSGQYEVVDDLKLCFKDIILGTYQFFISATMDEELKVKNHSTQRIRIN